MLRWMANGNIMSIAFLLPLVRPRQVRRRPGTPERVPPPPFSRTLTAGSSVNLCLRYPNKGTKEGG